MHAALLFARINMHAHTNTCAPPSAYEGFNAAVGLLGVYNDAILSERPGQEQLARWALWLAAVEQVRVAGRKGGFV